jgi:hypothetical protein
MHGSKSKISNKKSCPYIYVKFLALLGAPDMYNISRLRVTVQPSTGHEDPEGE